MYNVYYFIDAYNLFFIHCISLHNLLVQIISFTPFSSFDVLSLFFLLTEDVM